MNGGARGSAIAGGFVLLAAGALVSCGDRGPAPDASPGPVEDRAIFAALLKDACEHAGAPGMEDLVYDVPAVLDEEGTEHWKWQPSAELVAGLVRRGASDVRWPKSRPCASQRVEDGARVEALIASDGTIPPSFEQFRAAFPRVRYLVRISLPAYASDGRHAVVLRTFRREIISNAGDVVELERIGEAWRPTQEHNVWISVF